MDSDAGSLTCDICKRGHHPKRLPFFCAIDARNALYEGRITTAQALIKSDELERQISALLEANRSAPANTEPNRHTQTYVDVCVSEEQKSRDRTEKIIAASEKLQKEVEEAKRAIERRKSAVAGRKSELHSASQGIAARRNREVEEAKRATKMTKYTWDREHEAMSQYRAALCTEVAKLYRLQRVRRGNPVRFEYRIGGIELIDLQHLNGTNPEHISASLGHVAHLLWLASHYLSIRLPAEITLPHNDYPRPTIFSLASSYHHGQVAFPGASPLPVDPRDRQYGHVPHPRPLFLDKAPSSFSKDESQSYTAFLEGVCLLSYNIVWLCRTQGVTVNDNTDNFEDFCCMGRNLYNLLIGSSLQRSQPGNPLISESNGSAPQKSSSGENVDNNFTMGTPKMGYWSHGTTHNFLAGTAGTEFTRSFKMPNPIKLADKLKARLMNEAPVPEWEVIGDDEFGPNDLDDGVLVGGTGVYRSNPKAASRFGIESYMSVNTMKSGDSSDRNAAGNQKEKNMNGWTKIKPR